MISAPIKTDHISKAANKRTGSCILYFSQKYLRKI